MNPLKFVCIRVLPNEVRPILRILIAGLIAGMTIAGGACSGTQPREKVINEKKVPVVKIGSLKKNPSLYLDKMITVKGEYRGWRAEGSPPVSRSDWGVRDETGSIYVICKTRCKVYIKNEDITNKFSGLDPYEDIGRKIAVTGTLHLQGKIPYIKAVKIEIEKEE